MSGIIGFGGAVVGATNFTGAGVLQIKSISIDGVGCDAVDTTNMDSAGQFSEAIPGIKRAGSLTLTVVYKESEYDKVIDAVGDAAETWVITFADSSHYDQDGFVSDVGLVCENEGALEYTMTLTMTGAPSFTVV